MRIGAGLVRFVLLVLCLSPSACSTGAETDSKQSGRAHPGATTDEAGSRADAGGNAGGDVPVDEVPVDECPADPKKTEPGYCGCGTQEGTCCERLESTAVKTLGGRYSYFGQPYSNDLDLDGIAPDETKLVQIIKDQTIEPAASGESFAVLDGFIKIDEPGTYEFKPGYGASTLNVMTIEGKEVHRRNPGEDESERRTTKVYLDTGYHPFRVIFFETINPLAIWKNDTRLGEQDLWHDEPFNPQDEARIVETLTSLQRHVTGAKILSEGQMAQHIVALQDASAAFGMSRAIIQAAHGLVETYESTSGPLWVGEATKGGFRRDSLAPDIHTAILHVMQAIVDFGYSTETVGKCSQLLAGLRFQSADYFPGKVTSSPDPGRPHQVKVNASQPKMWGREVMYVKDPARRPTGAYLPPGTIATIVVPQSLVGKGYTIRVGAHSWDLSNRPYIKRLDRSSLVFDITSRRVQIASPLGGGIYLEVPYLADSGVVEISVENAVRAPYFSAKPFHTTSLSEWQDTERNFGAPWADFQSEKFMMNVPTSWISKLEDPATLMQDWDEAMDATNDLMGYPHISGKETMYPQVDVIMRASVFAPGYPSVNATYDPNRDYGGVANSHLVKGPELAPDYEFHEKGHGYGFVKYGGEQESTVNLLHVAVLNQKFGYSLDEAFRKSRGSSNEFATLETTAVTWMTSFNFSPRKVPMASGEKAYQLKGHAKFVDIARLFGWNVLSDFWRSTNEDYESGIEWSKHGTPIDDISLRLSEKAGVDLTPLLHFWGIHPEDPDGLKQRIAKAALPPSPAIYDTLVKYQSLVPADNAAFQAFALKWWGKKPSVDGYWTESEHARQFDSEAHLDKWNPAIRENGEIYDEKAAQAVRAAVQEIIDLYFHGGRP